MKGREQGSLAEAIVQKFAEKEPLFVANRDLPSLKSCIYCGGETQDDGSFLHDGADEIHTCPWVAARRYMLLVGA